MVSVQQAVILLYSFIIQNPQKLKLRLLKCLYFQG